MTPELKYLYITRFVLQAKTPVAVNSGMNDGVFDTLLVKDGNGLPAIPGTSLAGVLRHCFLDRLQTQNTDHIIDGNRNEDICTIFGFAGKKGDGAASRLHVSWGCIHGSDDIPVEGLCTDLEKLKKDSLLSFMMEEHPLHRNRVRINSRGVAQDKGKFDMTVVPAGCRFSFEISYWADSPDDQHWEVITSILDSPVYLGASSRSGLGEFFCIKRFEKKFDLSNKKDWNDFKCLPASLADYSGMKGDLQKLSDKEKSDSGKNSNQKGVTTLSVNLVGEDLWRFGDEGAPLVSAKKDPDQVTRVEPVVDWTKSPATFSPRKIVVPGSSIKGALNHRTRFHLNRLRNNYADVPGLDPETENILFGSERNDNKGRETGRAGALRISDIFLDHNPNEHKVAHLTHNSLDRFTGGTRETVLFSEELVWKREFKLKVHIDETRLALYVLQVTNNDKREERRKLIADWKKAFSMALEDLCSGRLALGAGSAKGHGYFQSKPDWSKAGEGWHNQIIRGA